MAIDFPASPTLNDTFTASGVTYTWDGTVWVASGSAAFVQKSGDTITGNLTLDADLTVDTNTLYVDSANDRVGIGTSSPTQKLVVKGDNDGIRIEDGNATDGYNIFRNDISGSLEFVGDQATFSGYKFFTNNTDEVLTILNNGSVLIQRTSNPDGGVLVIDQDASSNNVGISTITTNTSSRFHLLFRNGNGQVGSIATNGSATSFNTSSDYRLKENVVDLDGAIDRVKQLAPRRFNFIADADTTVDGFLAHEAQTVVPEAVTGAHDEVDDDGNAVYQAIDQSKLVPLLTAALQEAITKIETLETQNADLAARIEALEQA